MKILSALVLAILPVAAESPSIPLAGEWRFALDAPDSGLAAGPDGWKFPDKIQLPGMLTAQGFGEEPSMKTAWTGDGWRYPELFKEWQAADNFKFPFFLQPPRQYVGPAWYQRDVEIPADWNGVVGEMTLSALPANRIDRVDVYPANDGQVRLVVTGNAKGSLELRATCDGAITSKRIDADGDFTATLEGKVGFKPELWSEFSPRLYDVTVSLGDDSRITRFGFREIENKDGKLVLNGRQAFLRGTLECAIFPLTGHPPTDVDSWKRIVKICKDHAPSGRMKIATAASAEWRSSATVAAASPPQTSRPALKTSASISRPGHPQRGPHPAPRRRSRCTLCRHCGNRSGAGGIISHAIKRKTHCRPAGRDVSRLRVRISITRALTTSANLDFI